MRPRAALAVLGQVAVAQIARPCSAGDGRRRHETHPLPWPPRYQKWLWHAARLQHSARTPLSLLQPQPPATTAKASDEKDAYVTRSRSKWTETRRTDMPTHRMRVTAELAAASASVLGEVCRHSTSGTQKVCSLGTTSRWAQPRPQTCHSVHAAGSVRIRANTLMPAHSGDGTRSTSAGSTSGRRRHGAGRNGEDTVGGNGGQLGTRP